MGGAWGWRLGTLLCCVMRTCVISCVTQASKGLDWVLLEVHSAGGWSRAVVCIRLVDGPGLWCAVLPVWRACEGRKVDWVWLALPCGAAAAV